jgi:hypothetical protein
VLLLRVCAIHWLANRVAVHPDRYVEGPTGDSAIKAHTADEAVPVVGANGSIEIAVLQDGLPVAAEVTSDGELQPKMDGRGRTRAIVGPDGHRAKEVMAIGPIETENGFVIPKLTAVIGADGVPVPAIIIDNNCPVEVRVSTTGQIVPVRGKDGNFVIIVDGTGQHATTVQPASELRLVASTSGEGTNVVVRTEDGAMTRAELGDDGMAQPALDFGGQHEAVPGKAIDDDDVAAVVADMAPTAKSAPPAAEVEKAQKVVVVKDTNGQPVPAIVSADGHHLRANVMNGKLVPMRDKGGKFVPMPAISETSLDILQPTDEASNAEILHAAMGSPQVMDHDFEAKVWHVPDCLATVLSTRGGVLLACPSPHGAALDASLIRPLPHTGASATC